MEMEALLCQLRPLLLHVDQEGVQGLHNVYSIDCFTFGHHVCIDQSCGLKEGEHHLLVPAGVDTCFDWARLSLRDPLFVGTVFFSSGVYRLIIASSIVTMVSK